jgi:DNA-binding GntR family transcriptional regulator
MLQTEGLLEAAPNRGAAVRTYETEDLDDLYQLRAVLEGFAARLAAARISAGDVTRLRESCERFVALRAEADVVELVRENVLFHDLILEAAGSERLTQMVRTVIQLPLVYRSYHWYSPEQKLISEHYHRQLTSALATRDAERAEIVMKEHVLEARDFLIAQLRVQRSEDGEEAA